ncbi:MAG: OmpA family protein [Legionellales bacterium]|nr:OmpA family protein [Legionellales bacterium]
MTIVHRTKAHDLGALTLIKPSLIWKSLAILGMALIYTGCSSPPNTDNNFKSSFSIFLYRNTQAYIVSQLEDEDIQFIEYGDTMTLIIPTDSYFQNDSSELNEISGVYQGLNNVVKLLRKYPKSNPINVAGFTDDSGDSDSQKTLTQGQAETIATYLWANGISATSLKTEGYGDSYSLGSNQSNHSSSYNRRVEIQWSSSAPPTEVSATHPCPPSSCLSPCTQTELSNRPHIRKKCTKHDKTCPS